MLFLYVFVWNTLYPIGGDWWVHAWKGHLPLFIYSPFISLLLIIIHNYVSVIQWSIYLAFNLPYDELTYFPSKKNINKILFAAYRVSNLNDLYCREWMVQMSEMRSFFMIIIIACVFIFSFLFFYTPSNNIMIYRKCDDKYPLYKWHPKLNLDVGDSSASQILLLTCLLGARLVNVIWVAFNDGCRNIE